MEEIALYTDLEEYSQDDDAVVMMTMHAAKGLEFPYVFLVGFEEGLFPGMRAIGDREEMEEERRLCYVAITRAKEKLTISYAKQRMLYGKTNASMPSRFLREIPERILQRNNTVRTSAYTAGNAYIQRNTGSLYRAEIAKAATAPKTSVPEFNKGDMVQHSAFGKGMVLSVLKMSGDALLEIAFDQIGTKKLMAKTAANHMKRL